MKSFLILFSIVLITFLFQSTLVPLFPIKGVVIDFSLVILINLSLLLGPKRGISLGLFLGVFKDLYGSGFFGIHLFIKTILSFFAGSISQSIYPYNLLVPFLTVFGATVFKQILSTLLSEALIFTINREWLLQRVLLQALFNGLLTLFIFPMCQGIKGILVKRKLL